MKTVPQATWTRHVPDHFTNKDEWQDTLQCRFSSFLFLWFLPLPFPINWHTWGFSRYLPIWEVKVTPDHDSRSHIRHSWARNHFVTHNSHVLGGGVPDTSVPPHRWYFPGLWGDCDFLPNVFSFCIVHKEMISQFFPGSNFCEIFRFTCPVTAGGCF